MSADERDLEDGPRGFIAALEPGRVEVTDGGVVCRDLGGTLPPGGRNEETGSPCELAPSPGAAEPGRQVDDEGEDDDEPLEVADPVG
ncbi:MAG: hypothetical protein K0R41_234 [Geminicoccaceae bacterium]|nr:hypothetical protein [Solirubrobacterales bacterium]MCE3246409.1 hypothetical protein [Geminicoccaceae bacterium]